MYTVAVKVVVNVPATLSALVAFKFAQMAAAGGAAVIQGATITVERLGDNGDIVAVDVRETHKGEENEKEGHKVLVANRVGGDGHSRKRAQGSRYMNEYMSKKQVHETINASVGGRILDVKS